MKYVYILESVGSENGYYVGVTDDLKARLSRHNSGEVAHTAQVPAMETQDIHRVFGRSVGLCI